MGRRRRGTKSNTDPKPKPSDDENRDLPEEPLLKILETFPIKTLCRFRCVSNRWNSIISDPLFIRHYLSLLSSSSSSSSLPWTLVYRDGFCNKTIPDVLKFNRLYSDENFYNNDRAVFSVLEFPSYVREKHQAFSNNYAVLASSGDGLLLCRVNFPTIYYVCSPLIRQWVALPRHTQSSPFGSEGLVTRVEGGIVTSYKVVRLLFCQGKEVSIYDNYSSCVHGIEVFSSDTGKWRTAKVSSDFPKIDVRLRPFSFNGMLHWNASPGLVAYDPYKNRYRLIGFPPELDRVWCGVCQGHLQCIVAVFNGFQVWVPDDDSYKGKYRSLEHNIENLSRDYVALASHPLDSDKIYLCNKTKIFSYDFVTGRLTMLLDVVFGNLSASMVLPFVVPPWPTSVPKPSW